MLTGQSPINELSDQTAIINEMVLYSIIATELQIDLVFLARKGQSLCQSMSRSHLFRVVHYLDQTTAMSLPGC